MPSDFDRLLQIPAGCNSLNISESIRWLMTCLSLVQFCYSNSLLLLHVWGTPLQFRSDPRVEKETIRPFHESYRQFKLTSYAARKSGNARRKPGTGFSEAIRQFGPRKRHKCGLNVLPSGKTFKLLPAHAQIGMYFMYRGAVPGPNARINPLSIEDFIILDIVPVDVSSRS